MFDDPRRVEAPIHRVQILTIKSIKNSFWRLRDWVGFFGLSFFFSLFLETELIESLLLLIEINSLLTTLSLQFIVIALGSQIKPQNENPSIHSTVQNEILTKKIRYEMWSWSSENKIKKSWNLKHSWAPEVPKIQNTKDKSVHFMTMFGFAKLENDNNKR
jgi:hypothetical protein